jgi:nitrous oxide reductase accessory protein NosL
MLKRMIAICFLAAAIIGTLSLPALAQKDIDTHRSCAHCGMDRKAFGYSRMLVLYEDGTQTGVCSLQCVITEFAAQRAKKVKALQVADRDTQQLIAAEKAIWVMGGSKRGVMTMQPKWAFTTEAAAKAFIKANGGKIVSWDKAFTAAQEEAKPTKR